MAAALPAHAAFVVDQVQVRRVGPDAVLDVKFVTEVQFLRLVAPASGDLSVISYRVVSMTNREIGKGSQLIALEHIEGLRRLRLTDEAEQGDRERRLVLKLDTRLPARARAGRDNRSLEIVLPGLGERLALPDTQAAKPPAPPAPVAVAPAPAQPASAPPPAGGAVTPPVPPSAVASAPQAAVVSDVDRAARAAALLRTARDALGTAEPARALESLNALLELPPNPSTREAQELAGQAHLRLGDTERARAEFETFLQLYPQGDDSERVRARLAALPARPVAAPAPAPMAELRPEEVTLDGSTSMNYYGGNGKLRSQDFQDSPISGLPEVIGDPLFSADKQRQLITDLDVNWRRRTADVDQRAVFRDAYTSDFERSDKSKNRLTALYFDHRSLRDGWGARVGRQSPSGGGVMGRFDGLQGYWLMRPKLKLSAVGGVPTDKFFDSKRHFYGLSVDADRLVGNLGAGVFAIEQRIDGETDRRALGFDMRYFDGGLSAFGQVDYDVAIGGLNVATLQGTYITEDNTVYTALLDRRALTTLSLGNALTFEDPANPGVLVTRIRDRLANTTVQALRDLVKRITPNLTQAQLGITKPITEHWQTGGSVQLTNTGAIPPVPEVPGFEDGRPATGDIVTASAQLIGLNLYSPRDTHVFAASVIRGPTLDGVVLSYNNSSYLWEHWQLEPSLQYYGDTQPGGSHSQRWTPGLRVTYRGWKRWALETGLTYEIGSAKRVLPDPNQPGQSTTTRESTSRVNYSLGARFEF